MVLKDQLSHIIESLSQVGFEMVLIGGSLLLLLLGLIAKRSLVSQIVYVLVLVLAMTLVPLPTDLGVWFGGALAVQELTWLFRLVFSFLGVWVVFYPTANRHPFEYYFLLLAVIAGSAFMLSAQHLLVIYLAIELTSFASYLLTNFNFEKRSFEAGIKYLIFGGTASALALYGASLIYGFTGTLLVSEMDFALVQNPALLNVGLLLFIGAMLFKVSLVPFHIWVPTTYQVAPTSAVAILSVIPKIAGFVLLHRVLLAVDVHTQYWLYVVIVAVGMATIVIGTLGALRQTNIKRMIAYGAIAHSGFLLGALLIPGETGVVAFAWYALAYGIINLVAFYMVSVLEDRQLLDVKDLAGLSRTEGYFGGLITIVMVALIGLPPTVGFTIKFYLFTALWGWYQTVVDPWIMGYLVVALMSVVFSLFFYLKVPYFIFLKESDGDVQSVTNPGQRVIATIFTLVLLWLFISPDILNNIADNIKSIAW
ncbi:NADH-quinone oxidoreductase subunit N [Marinoscillum furvescens]|uniref:NADH-quinone oxidoreductase subunit N n=1 Tax=Marinoscillum furvescens DSM 4134 TaxID=1122208 RepID=A0A3D9KXP6_MARFU|nr:NADH-quinone oxidoreductase subunit N [Marinoscillum furvescens]RED91887.1 NADH dehydrogenase subunit N [Marinoscillum furvescens DSM 4134]